MIHGFELDGREWRFVLVRRRDAGALLPGYFLEPRDRAGPLYVPGGKAWVLIPLVYSSGTVWATRNAADYSAHSKKFSTFKRARAYAEEQIEIEFRAEAARWRLCP